MSDHSISTIQKAMDKHGKDSAVTELHKVELPNPYPSESDSSTQPTMDDLKPDLELSVIFTSIWWQRRVGIFVFMILATILVGANSRIFPDKYEASSSVRVKTSGIDFGDEGTRDVNILTNEILSNQVLSGVIEELNLNVRDKIPALESLVTDHLGLEPGTSSDSTGILRWLKGSVRIQQEQVGSTTAVFTISLTDKDPEGITAIVNAITDTYLDLRHSFSIADKLETLEFLGPKVTVAQERLKKAEEAVAAYQEENADYLVPVESIDSTISRFDREVIDAKIQVAQLTEINARLSKLIKIVPMFGSAQVSGSTGNIHGRLEELETELALNKATRGPKHPTMILLKRQIARIKESIRDNPKTIGDRPVNPDYLRIHQQIDENSASLTVLSARIPEILNEIEGLRIHKTHVKVSQTALSALQQEWTRARSNLNRLDNRLSEVQVEYDARHDKVGRDMEILDYASVPTLPISAGRQQLLLVGIALAGVLAAVFLLGRAALKGWNVPRPKPLGTVKSILRITVVTLWVVAILGYITVTPYI